MKNNRKKIIASMIDKTIATSLLLTLLIMETVQSQSAKQPRAKEIKAKEILTEVASKIKGYDNIALQFQYVLENKKEKIYQKSTGELTMKENKYVLSFLGVTKIYDGLKSYVIVTEDQEITISTPKEEDDNAITPSKIFTFFQQGYKYNIDRDKINGEKIIYIRLTPTKLGGKRKEVVLGINSATKNIYSLEEVGEKGTKTTLTVLSFKTNQPLSKNYFVFSESNYPNYYINRLD